MSVCSRFRDLFGAIAEEYKKPHREMWLFFVLAPNGARDMNVRGFVLAPNGARDMNARGFVLAPNGAR
ncbi:MAG: hypothetical protein II180_02425, partial [Proteobacteria bacterium]|nr:hypothetical protein [Pseudomonadota bacterium]